MTQLKLLQVFNKKLFFLYKDCEFCSKAVGMLHSCCRALAPNVIIDREDDANDEEEEEKTAAATEQFVTDTAHVLPVKQPSEASSDTSDNG